MRSDNGREIGGLPSPVLEIVLADTGRFYLRHIPSADLCCHQGHIGRYQAKQHGEDRFGQLPTPKRLKKDERVKTYLFHVQWVRFKVQHRAIVRAESAHKAVVFCRQHYGSDVGPANKFKVEETCEADADKAHCDKLNALQISFI